MEAGSNGTPDETERSHARAWSSIRKPFQQVRRAAFRSVTSACRKKRLFRLDIPVPQQSWRYFVPLPTSVAREEVDKPSESRGDLPQQSQTLWQIRPPTEADVSIVCVLQRQVPDRPGAQMSQ